jgi:hypothetical protein
MALALIAILGTFAFIALTFTYGTLVWGFITYKAYAWFIVAPFAFSPITFAQAIAISTIIGVVHARFMKREDNNLLSDDEEKRKEAWSSLIGAIIAPWVTLFFMWCVKIFFI